MKPTSKAPKILPTLALVLNAAPVVLSLILIALSAGGNWAFLILGGIVYCVSTVLCGITSLALGDPLYPQALGTGPRHYRRGSVGTGFALDS